MAGRSQLIKAMLPVIVVATLVGGVIGGLVVWGLSGSGSAPGSDRARIAILDQRIAQQSDAIQELTEEVNRMQHRIGMERRSGSDETAALGPAPEGQGNDNLPPIHRDRENRFDGYADLMLLSARRRTNEGLKTIPQRRLVEIFGRPAEGLGQEMFTGSTGRVFPRAMKASPLLRAWLTRLAGLGVRTHTRHRCVGWDGDRPLVQSPDGEPKAVDAQATVLAMGGASWARLGSDGAWAGWIGAPVEQFAPSNAALFVNWSDHMARHMGTPIKGVGWRAGGFRSRGEAVLSHRGLEGGGIYTVSRGVREGAPLMVDMMPDLSVDDVAQRLAKPRGKQSLANHLRKTLRLDPVKVALMQEWGRPLPDDPVKLARRLKRLRVRHAGLRPLDEAISTSGGVPFSALNGRLMLRDRPGVFCAGEMLDWEAPTGGYLLTACLATGRWAGRGAVDYLAAAS